MKKRLYIFLFIFLFKITFTVHATADTWTVTLPYDNGNTNLVGSLSWAIAAAVHDANNNVYSSYQGVNARVYLDVPSPGIIYMKSQININLQHGSLIIAPNTANPNLYPVQGFAIDITNTGSGSVFQDINFINMFNITTQYPTGGYYDFPTTNPSGNIPITFEGLSFFNFMSEEDGNDLIQPAWDNIQGREVISITDDQTHPIMALAINNCKFINNQQDIFTGDNSTGSYSLINSVSINNSVFDNSNWPTTGGGPLSYGFVPIFLNCKTFNMQSSTFTGENNNFNDVNLYCSQSCTVNQCSFFENMGLWCAGEFFSYSSNHGVIPSLSITNNIFNTGTYGNSAILLVNPLINTVLDGNKFANNYIDIGVLSDNVTTATQCGLELIGPTAPSGFTHKNATNQFNYLGAPYSTASFSEGNACTTNSISQSSTKIVGYSNLSLLDFKTKLSTPGSIARAVTNIVQTNACVITAGGGCNSVLTYNITSLNLISNQLTVNFTTSGNLATSETYTADVYKSNNKNNHLQFVGSKVFTGNGGTNYAVTLPTTILSCGDYVAITVTSAGGTFGSGTFSTVSAVIPNAACPNSATINYSAPPSCLGASIPFSVSLGFPNTCVQGTGTQTYLWNFGDGTTSTLQSPTHIYTSANTFNVSCVINTTISGSSQQCSPVTANTTIVINNSCPLSASMSNSGANASCLGGVNTFNANITYPTSPSCPLPGTNSYLWDFGDGSATSTIQSPTHIYTSSGNFQATCTIITSIAGTTQSCPQVVATPINLTINPPECPSSSQLTTSGPLCAGESTTFGLNVTLTNPSSCFVPENFTFTWDFGDGYQTTGTAPSHLYSNADGYTITYTISTTIPGYSSSCSDVHGSTNVIVQADCCPSCLPSFQLVPGKKYVVGAWASEENKQKSTFTLPQVFLKFTTGTSSSVVLGPFKPKYQVIEGWQRIEEVFTVPAGATDVDVQLTSSGPNNTAATENVYFDDIRVHPFDASFKSFVYDPVTLKFVAELDNNNYATFYEYDDEGKLVRVKKETENRIYTVKESRNGYPKK